MIFDGSERSVEGSQPIEVWSIVTPSATYRRTTAEVNQVISGDTYTAVSGARSEVSAASVNDPPEMVLTLPVSDVFVQDHAFGMPPQSIELTITRHQGSASLTWWKGPISAFTVKGDWCTIRSPSQLADALETTMPSAHVQRQCNHVLYDDRCTMDSEDSSFKTTTTVTSVSADGLTVVVASLGTLGSHLKSGHITRSADGDKRLILAVVVATKTLTLNAPFRALGVGNAVVLRIGCQHDIADCVATFNNAINFGGHPYMPVSNPWQGSIVGRFPA